MILPVAGCRLPVRVLRWSEVTRIAVVIFLMVTAATVASGEIHGDGDGWQIFLMAAGAVAIALRKILGKVYGCYCCYFLMVLQGYSGTSNKIEATMKTTIIYSLLF